MESGQKQMILFFGLSTTRADYFERMTAGKLYLKNMTVAEDETLLQYSFDRYISYLRDTLRTKGSKLTSPEQWEKFSYEWPEYIKSEYRDWPLWKDYYYHTQQNYKNWFARLYKGTVAQRYFFVKAYSKNYRPDEFSVLKLPDNKELGRYIYSELAKDPNVDLGEHRYAYVKKGEMYSPVFHTVRGSKIGIDIAKTNPNVTIYFLLDGLDMKRVLTKPRIKMPTINVTNHELRYIYRNWSQLEGKIIFFNDGKEVAPPWHTSEYKKMWQAYKPKSFQNNNWLRKKWAIFRHKKVGTQQKVVNNKYNEYSNVQGRFFVDIQQQLKQDKTKFSEDRDKKNRPLQETRQPDNRMFVEKTIRRVEKIAYWRNEAVASKANRQRAKKEFLRS
ncbi:MULTISPECIES: hypothetical protein [Enterococcus]|uniref:hypothetical protein n=1 Tax=Enterococcus TaxID=1350 RepID=UPI0007EEE449|nr:hypothetical protein [Enterococcus mundtii]OBS62317.1 hypothetical protein AX758_11120 [Enterococcus mundtii]